MIADGYWLYALSDPLDCWPALGVDGVFSSDFKVVETDGKW